MAEELVLEEKVKDLMARAVTCQMFTQGGRIADEYGPDDPAASAVACLMIAHAILASFDKESGFIALATLIDSLGKEVVKSARKEPSWPK